ncbi:hypothetical protein [Clostridium sp. AWRP]|uniref:hypothetical protein n=1 Tax=Clostridium sp. AWRP TaxID=2212991 RepID=UPI000FD9E5CE|nr:hypothetical protein [Clostridium sp. AWRP]AZV55410.1 hypothetical protein DMR38_01640 [Clostridium sp. AWRP]
MKKRYNKIKTKQSPKTELLIVFSVVFVAEIIGGIYFSYFKGILLNDAFSRTANAFYVLYIKPIRLASIGLVWNPLPSIMQLPFMEIAKVWRPMASSGISAVIITSFFAAMSAVLLLKAFTRFYIPKKYSILIIFLYVSNPFIFFYGMNGMSESIFFFIAMYAVTYMTFWMSEGKPEYIIKIAFALTAAFYCRYEAIPFAAAIGLAVLINIFFNKKEKQFIPADNRKEMYYYAEGTAIVLYAPFLYGILLWIFLNWTITGNPLYFLNSVYSNTAQSQYAITTSTSSTVFGYVSQKSLPFLPLFFGIVLIRIVTKKLLQSDFFMLFILVLTMLIFHYVMLLGGNSYGWLRFFSYSYPICMAWLPYELYKTKSRYKHIAAIVISLAMIISSVLTGFTLSNPVLSPEEHEVVVDKQTVEIADYINDQLPDNKILMDSFVTSGIILNVKNVNNLVVCSSLNFNECVDNPAKHGIEYIVVPDPNGVGTLDAINRKYPYLYSNGADWCVLEEEFEEYKIFKVKD